MLCFSDYGQTVDGFKHDIQDAQAAGLDGFVLNITTWDNTQVYYKTNMSLMYLAAEQLGTGFKFIISVNFPGETNVLDVMRTYANRTNTFRYNGRVVLSAWGGNDVPSAGWYGMDWTNAIIGELNKEGIPIFFIPFFYSNPVNEIPNYGNATELLGRYGSLLDGLFDWTAAGLPPQLAQSDDDYTRAVHQAGKTVMAGICPAYWGLNQYGLSRRYYEFDGGEGIALQWSAIVTNQPDWVEICTWNDFNEGTYLSPIDSPGQYEAQVQSPVRYTHKGFLELSKRFISWYKTGQQPATSQDALYYFYRTHPMNLVAGNTNDTWVGWRTGDIADSLYTTVFLTSPANLEVSSGGRLSTNSLSTGMNQVRIPFQPGAQKFTLRRAGIQILTIQGDDIQSQIQNYDFFLTSGFAYGATGSIYPPTGLHQLRQ